MVISPTSYEVHQGPGVHLKQPQHKPLRARVWDALIAAFAGVCWVWILSAQPEPLFISPGKVATCAPV